MKDKKAISWLTVKEHFTIHNISLEGVSATILLQYNWTLLGSLKRAYGELKGKEIFASL
jgi:hypothetical protein